MNTRNSKGVATRRPGRVLQAEYKCPSCGHEFVFFSDGGVDKFKKMPCTKCGKVFSTREVQHA